MTSQLQRVSGWLQLHVLRNPQVLVTIICLFCFVAPALMVLLGAFRTNPFGAAEWTLVPWTEVFSSERTWRTIGTTVLMGIVTISLSTVMALVLAAIYTRTNTPLRQAIPVIMVMIVAIPGLFYAMGWALLGNAQVGIVNQLLGALFGDAARVVDMQSWWGIVFVSSFRLVALQFFLLLGPFMNMDASLDEAARISGSSPVGAFFRIQVSVIMPAVSGVVILGFVLFLESFDIPQVLGVPANIYVMSTDIYSYLSSTDGAAYGHASSLSVGLMVVLLALVYIQVKVLGRRGFATVGGKGARGLRRDVGGWRWLFTAVIVGFALFALVAPIVQILLVSFTPFVGATDGYSWDNYVEALGTKSLLEAFGTTALVATVGGLLAVIASTFFTWTARFRRGALARIIEVSQWISLAMPGIVTALGVLWLFLSIPGLDQFYATPVILVFGLFVGLIPIVGRATTGAISQISVTLEEAAWQSGASKPWTLFGIVARLILPSLLSGWILSFIIICGALSAPLILAGPRARFLAVEVYNLYTMGRAPVAAAVFMIFLVALALLGALSVVITRVWGRALVKGSTSSRTAKSMDSGGPAAGDDAPVSETLAIATRARGRRD